MVVPCSEFEELIPKQVEKVISSFHQFIGPDKDIIRMTEISTKPSLNEFMNGESINSHEQEAMKDLLDSTALDQSSNISFKNTKKKSKMKDGCKGKKDSISFESSPKSLPFPQGFLLTPFCTPPDLFLSHSYLMELKDPPKNLTNHSDWDQLSNDIWECFQKNQQTESMYRNKMALWKYLFVFIKSMYPAYGLYVVGSTLSGFGLNRSDVDMCLLVRPKDLGRERSEIVCLTNILDVISDIEFIKKPELIPAKVPLLKFVDEQRQIEVDLNCNSLVGIRNTHLLFCYSQLDERVRPLIISIKVWARSQGINDAKNGSISSYSLTLMAIHFLQCGVDPPVLPCLHKMYPDKFFPDQPITRINIHEKIPPYCSGNQMPLGELLVRFLEYFSEFEFLTYAMSVREGTVLTAKDCRSLSSPRSLHTQWNYICVEEPFEFTNTASAVFDVFMFERILSVMRKSAELLRRTKRLESIFETKFE